MKPVRRFFLYVKCNCRRVNLKFHLSSANTKFLKIATKRKIGIKSLKILLFHWHHSYYYFNSAVKYSQKESQLQNINKIFSLTIINYHHLKTFSAFTLEMNVSFSHFTVQLYDRLNVGYKTATLVFYLEEAKRVVRIKCFSW